MADSANLHQPVLFNGHWLSLVPNRLRSSLHPRPAGRDFICWPASRLWPGLTVSRLAALMANQSLAFGARYTRLAWPVVGVLPGFGRSLALRIAVSLLSTSFHVLLQKSHSTT